jgi:hypothetical protein
MNMSKNDPITNPSELRPEPERFEDALRLLAKIIARDMLRKQSGCLQHNPPQAKVQQKSTADE